MNKISRIIIATENKGKVREIREILKNPELSVMTMAEAGISASIEENGKTFSENARIKVEAIPAQPDACILGDDSGLEIDCLGGEPGIYSARYLGRDTPYPEKNRIILERLASVPDTQRTARFVCAIAAKLPDGSILGVTDTMEGRIAHEIRFFSG